MTTQPMVVIRIVTSNQQHILYISFIGDIHLSIYRYTNTVHLIMPQ